ncbi:MAG TPA: cupredoxin domain-containing protein [Bacilli bacterium]
MNITNKIYLFLIIIFCLIALAGCSSNDNKGEPSATEQPATVTPENDNATGEGNSTPTTTPMATIEPATAEPTKAPQATSAPAAVKPADEPSPSGHNHEATPKPTTKPTTKPTVKPTAKPTVKPSTSPTILNKKVEIKDFAFSPATLTIQAGAEVTFTNRDTVKHTATASDGSFNTGMLAKDTSAVVKFDKPGTYEYFCEPHPDMIATIIVE